MSLSNSLTSEMSPKKFPWSEAEFVGCSILGTSLLVLRIIGQSSLTHLRRRCCRWAPKDGPLVQATMCLIEALLCKQKKKMINDFHSNPSFWVLKAASWGKFLLIDVLLESFSVAVRTASDRLADLPALLFRRLWWSFLSGPAQQRAKECLYVSCHGDFSEVYIKLSSFSPQSFGKKGSFQFLMIPSQKDGGSWKPWFGELRPDMRNS